MNYSEFREKALKEIVNYLPGEYAGYFVKIDRIPKVNHIKESLHIYPEDEPAVVPNVYLDDLYNTFMQGKSFEDTMKIAADAYVCGVEKGRTMGFGADELINEYNIVFQLVNTWRNMSMLENVPHRSWLNLTIMYRAVIVCPDNGFYSTVINNDIAESHGWSEEELYHMAMENTPETMPLQRIEVEGTFNILTNGYKTMGAGVILYDGILHDFAEMKKDNLFLIPSSVHEMLVIPQNGREGEELNEILQSCNQNVLEIQEILSDTVYFYDRNTGVISIA